MLRFGIITVIVLIADQISKWLSLNYLKLNEVFYIVPWFNFKLAFNTGAAFGFLSNSSGWQRIFFIVLTIIAAIGIIIWLWKLNKNESLEGVALSFILGGALGNFVDRVRFGYVVDFIDIHYQDYFHWYTFNIADSAICIGAFILILSLLKNHKTT